MNNLETIKEIGKLTNLNFVNRDFVNDYYLNSNCSAYLLDQNNNIISLGIINKKLENAFNTKHIFSEYGMTELLSQAYFQKDGLFHTPSWMRILVREVHDPFHYIENSKTGLINVIDLANVHSCAFIETEDLGLKLNDGFKVLGRLDNSDLRGCNLLLS